MIDPKNIAYPEGLPICERRREIIELIKSNQVVVIAGETGSGKTTQIPKFCIEAGRGVRGRIACTQPRRIAAVSVATRIAEELGETLGSTVGYQIRFSDKTERSTVIKLMTDGILLSEAQHDRYLDRYDTIIIDEAHERSLNIDFILGLLKRILKKRKDLKAIITSATIDTRKFSKAFGDAPIIEVSGRTYPVEIRYRPLGKADQQRGADSLAEQAADEALSIVSRGHSGDILIFMPTEQDIRDTCDLLEAANPSNTLTFPLYARMPSSQQNRIFSATHERKIIVATNIAETSITIPGVTYVIDTGLARIANYSPATRTNALPVSPVSRSSADQRAGRCGRVSNGVCIRLYAQEDYAAREQYTVPEILRSNLAEVLLRMIALRVPDIEHFPFIDPPAKRAVRDGLSLLSELGAIRKKRGRSGDYRYELTKTGSFMAFLPLDPRISRILIEGSYRRCLREMAILAAVLSIQDPKERPLDKQKEADAAHKEFKDPDSDLITFLNIWDSYHEHWRKIQSKGKMRSYCQEKYVSFKRMRDWRDIHLQLTTILKEQGYAFHNTKLSKKPVKKDAASPFYEAIHTSFLSGYLSNIAEQKEKQYYTAPKNKECMIFPGSGVFANPPRWIASAEMVRTSKLFARNVARIEPEWILRLAGPLRQYSYRSMHWSFEREEVVAIRQTKVHGLTVEGNKEVGYGEIDPAASGALFNETVLVENADRYRDRFSFLAHNWKTVKEILELENRLRRRDIFTGAASLVDFYNERIKGVSSIQGLLRYLETHAEEDLRIEKSDFMLYVPTDEEMRLYPTNGSVGGTEYRLVYNYSPGEKNDGVTVVVDEQDAKNLNVRMIDWLVPGLLKEKIRFLIKALPKEYRRQLVPVNQTAEALYSMLPENPTVPLTEALGELIYREFETYVPPEAWNENDLPEHLSCIYQVQSLKGTPLRESRDAEVLAGGSPSAALHNEFAALKRKCERDGLTGWETETIEREITGRHGTTAYLAYSPSAGGIVDLRLFLDRTEAERTHSRGIAVLAAHYLRDILAIFKQEVLLPKSYSKTALYFGGLKVLNEGIWRTLIFDILGAQVYSKAAFLSFLKEVREDVYARMTQRREAYISVIKTYEETRMVINDLLSAAAGMAKKQEFLRSRLDDLRSCVSEEFYADYPFGRLPDIVRYAQCIGVRARKGSLNLSKDEANAQVISPFAQWYEKARKNMPEYASAEKKALLDEFKWALEELRIQVFAQEMKTAIKVSPKRLNQMAEDYEGLR